SVNPLEERIGYKFRNPLLLAEALTHPSLRHEKHREHFDNQRLEFLGDAVLQLVITEQLYGHFETEPEGKLTKLRSRLVSREALTVHAAAIELGNYLMMGRGEEVSGGRHRFGAAGGGAGRYQSQGSASGIAAIDFTAQPRLRAAFADRARARENVR